MMVRLNLLEENISLLSDSSSTSSPALEPSVGLKYQVMSSGVTSGSSSVIENERVTSWNNAVVTVGTVAMVTTGGAAREEYM